MKEKITERWKSMTKAGRIALVGGVAVVVVAVAAVAVWAVTTPGSTAQGQPDPSPAVESQEPVIPSEDPMVESQEPVIESEAVEPTPTPTPEPTPTPTPTPTPKPSTSTGSSTSSSTGSSSGSSSSSSGSSSTGSSSSGGSSTGSNTSSNTGSSSGSSSTGGSSNTNPSTYSCGFSNHHCHSESEHIMIAEHEAAGCRYCGSHSCPSFYAVNLWGGAYVDTELCPQYNAQSDPSKYCQTCGKPVGYGTDGTCVTFNQSMNCPNCGAWVEAWVCHTCK